MNRRGQADIISAVLIIVLALGLVTTAYTWGIPLIQKRQDTAIVDRVKNYFNQNNANSLPNKIEYIANNGGEETFTLDVSGFWVLHSCPQGELANCRDTTPENNSLEFSFFSKVSNIAVGAGWVSLTTGSSAACPPFIGIVGKDRSSVVCARADSVGDGYNITYKLWFRELDEPEGLTGYKIDLVKHEAGSYTSTGKSIRISRQSISQVSVGQKTLIIPEIKILLE